MISGALTLLTNAVIAYNTWKLHQVLERSREAGQLVPSDEILAVLVHLRIFGPKTTVSSPKTAILKSSTLVISMTYNQRRSRLVASAGAGEPPNPQMHQNPEIGSGASWDN
jgi:hypothetical protein